MKPDTRFLDLPKSLWADVRTISEAVGYTTRREKIIRAPTVGDIWQAYRSLDLTTQHLFEGSTLTDNGRKIIDYFEYRASVINNQVQHSLMDKARAEELFNSLRRELKPRCPLPMNKQKGDKRAPAYLTGIVNMLIERHTRDIGCDYDPRRLTTITRDNAPLRTLSRRVDGAFPSIVNPIAVWEIKEYYYTTTFGSRVADGVYETLLDGMELQELRDSEGIDIKHYLIVDAYYTWWQLGRSYLCRMIDMIHMGYVDEVLFGNEVVGRLPSIVQGWVQQLVGAESPT